ncbi:MAG: class I adenylate-forming enzyme family protein [Pseudomonadota bacterium]
MSWEIDEKRRLQTECLFGDRLVRCFAERSRSLDQLLRDAVLQNPTGDAIIDGHDRISYQGLNKIVDQIAANLVHRGVVQGDRVAILLRNSAAFIQVLLATARIGAIAVPINVREQTPELAYVLDHSAAKVLIHEKDLHDRLPVAKSIRHRFSVGGTDDAAAPFEDLLNHATVPPHVEVNEEDVAVILYTSGTTGKPKGAMLTHVNIAHSVMHFELCMGLAKSERSIIAVPASHITGLIANILTMIRTAGCSLILREFDVETFLNLAARERMTHTLMVPAMYNLCLLRADLGDYDLKAWRIGGYGGAPMPEATIATLADKLPGLVLMNAYGSTETCSPSTIMPPGETAGHPDSVGKAVPCAEIKIVDQEADEVPNGEAGEIWIKGPMIVPGYWNDPEKTKAGFREGYWRSGDVGSIDDEGFVRLHDRIKDMINRGGYNVYSAELENVLNFHPDVIECAAVAQPDEILGEKIHVFARTRVQAATPEQLREFCRDHLADYKVPDFVTIIEEALPRNANGKVLKETLRASIADSM